jgi:hypothetical protein
MSTTCNFKKIIKYGIQHFTDMVKCFPLLFNFLYETLCITTIQLQYMRAHTHAHRERERERELKTLMGVYLMIIVLWAVV